MGSFLIKPHGFHTVWRIIRFKLIAGSRALCIPVLKASWGPSGLSPETSTQHPWGSSWTLTHDYPSPLFSANSGYEKNTCLKTACVQQTPLLGKTLCIWDHFEKLMLMQGGQGVEEQLKCPFLLPLSLDSRMFQGSRPSAFRPHLWSSSLYWVVTETRLQLRIVFLIKVNHWNYTKSHFIQYFPKKCSRTYIVPLN